MRQQPFINIFALALMTIFFYSGCSKPGGGVDSEVAVTLKPSDLPLFESSDEPGDSTTPDTPTVLKSTGKPGTWKGRVIITGAVKELPPESTGSSKDAICKAKPIPNESVLSKNGGLQNVFIYLAKAPKGAKFPEVVEDDKVIFTNRGCRFYPHAMILRTKQTMMVTNEDPIVHNTKIETLLNQPFDSPVNPNDRVGIKVVYAKSEKIPALVKCSFHSWMKAYQLPLDHPYYAVTDAEGNFEIPNLPPGKHKFKIWHEAGGTLNNKYSVEIDGDKIDDVIKFSAKKFAKFEGPRSKTVLLSMSDR